MPPKELFSFESADFLQKGKSVRMPSKIDVFPFHIIGPHIQPDTQTALIDAVKADLKI